MSELFMSFIHEEERIAAGVQEFIQRVFEAKVDAFMSSDKNAIYAGEDWMNRIFDELKKTKVLISMLSPTSVARPWINFEAGAAWMRDTKVIPVCFGGLLLDNLPKPYSSLQAIDIRKHSGSHYLVTSIAHYLCLAAPKQPLFTDDAAVLALGTNNP